jgi:valyl-tRNA synthetase
LPWYDEAMHEQLNKQDKRIISELNMLKAAVTKNMENYRYSDATNKLYEFTWHRIADIYLEKNKDRFKTDEQALAVFGHVYRIILKLLHPFMPFVTEAIWNQIPRKTNIPLIISPWP